MKYLVNRRETVISLVGADDAEPRRNAGVAPVAPTKEGHKSVSVLGRVVVCDWISHRGCGQPLMAIRDAGDRREHLMCPKCGAFLCCDDPRWLGGDA